MNRLNITCSKYAQHNVFEGAGVSLDVILCGIKRLGNLAEVREKLEIRSNCAQNILKNKHYTTYCLKYLSLEFYLHSYRFNTR